MNPRIEDLMYQAGLTAQGCWDELGAYEQEAIEKLVKLIARECINIVEREASQYNAPVWSVEIINDICDTFGFEP